jgi:hypothetical protein
MASLALLHTQFHAVIWQYSMSLARGIGCGCLTRPWITINLQWLSVVRKKLAFQGLDAIKWTYTVMSFGPTNRPVIFINFIYDVNSIWKELAKKYGLTIDDDTNTCIIVDNIISWAGSFKRSLTYM